MNIGSVLRWFLGFGVVALIGAYLLVALALVMGATQADRKAANSLPDEFGVHYEEVTFPSREGNVDLSGWLIPGAPEQPSVIFVHGLDSERSADGAVDLASRLVGQGYNVLLFDLRGHGRSSGERISGGYFEREDVLGAYDFLVSRGAAAGRVGVVGFSLGGGVAIMAAAGEQGIVAVVADSAFADIDDLIAQETARKTFLSEKFVPVFLPAARLFADRLYGIDLGDISPERDAALLTFPILLIHGDADSRIPPSHSRRIHQRAHFGSELWTPEGVNHVDAFHAQPDEYARRVIGYFDARFADP
jgi:dipeptidyl aminopeptidase/acylaminoacyl peptidase